ncbi:unnamed protein product [Closterium sp. NIES-53]
MGRAEWGGADGDDDVGSPGRAEGPTAEEAGKRRERMGAEMRKAVAQLDKVEPAAVIDGLQRLHARIAKHGARAVDAYVRVSPPDWLQLLRLWDACHRRGASHQVGPPPIPLPASLRTQVCLSLLLRVPHRVRPQVALPLMAVLADILALAAHTPRPLPHTPARAPPSVPPPVLGAPLSLPRRIEALARALLPRCCRKGGLYAHLSSPSHAHATSALRLLLALSLITPALTRYLLLSFDFSLPALPALTQPPAPSQAPGSGGRGRGERGKHVGARGGAAGAVFWSGTPAVVVGGEQGEQGELGEEGDVGVEGEEGALGVLLGKQGVGACADVGDVPARVLMAEWVVACLAVVDAATLTHAIVAHRHNLAGILWRLAGDHPGALFGDSALEQMARVVGREEGGGAGAVAAGMALQVLLAVCTHPRHGVLVGGGGGGALQGRPQEGMDEGGEGEDMVEEGMGGGGKEGQGGAADTEGAGGEWEGESGKGGSASAAADSQASSHWSAGMDRLIRLARGLHVLQCAAHRSLLLAMAQACPPLAAAYLQRPPFSLHPTPHAHWFAGMALVSRLVRVCSTMPLLSASAPFSLHLPSPNISPLLARMLPPCLPRPALTRALLHRSPRVRLLALCTLLDCLSATLPLLALALPLAATHAHVGAAGEAGEGGEGGLWWARGNEGGDGGERRSEVNVEAVEERQVAGRYWSVVVAGVRAHVVGAVPDVQIVLGVLAASQPSSGEGGVDEGGHMALRGGPACGVRRAGGAGEGGRRKRGRGAAGEWQVMEEGGGEGEEGKEEEEGEGEMGEEEEEVEEEEGEEVGMDDEMDDEEEGGRWSVRLLLHCKALRLLALYQRVVPAAVATCHVDPLRFLRADLPSLPPPFLRATLRLLLAFFPPPSQRTLTFPGPGTGGSHSTLPLPAPAEAPPAGDESLCTFPLHNHLLPLLLLRLSPPPADLAPDVDWLCTAAMLSSHAFHARQSEAAIWLRFLPTMAPGSAGSSAAAARGVAAFLADAVACVARAPLKYLLALPAASPPPSHASHCPSCRARGHTPMGSLGPFPACILTNCLKVLHATSPSNASSSSSSSSSSPPVQLAIATFTCNALTYLISLQLSSTPSIPLPPAQTMSCHVHAAAASTHSFPPLSVPAPSSVRACTRSVRLFLPTSSLLFALAINSNALSRSLL